ncbi:MAG: glycerophosphodiester phosphodiesterase [Candidatus Aureabacteria bacterium]|nr:glycerophosphodiester phosphodiesterase [Candidatus Auribacterota bacterium]
MTFNTLNIAHRGASAYFKENTAPAFKKAVELGADYIELDARQTKDGEIIVFHDEAIGSAPISGQMLADITLQGRKRGIDIPLLSDIIKMFADIIGLNIEIKGNMDINLLADIAQPGKNKNLLFSSFGRKCLERLKNSHPGVTTGLLLNNVPKGLFKMLEQLDADALILKHYRLKRSLLEKAWEKGIKTTVWTVNNVKHMKKYVKWGVWGIITDYPDKLQKLTHTMGKGENED